MTKRFTVTNISANGMKGLFKLGNDILSVYDVVRLINELLEENEELKQQLKEYNQPNCKKCMEYSSDGVGDYCMSENGLLGGAWKMFPYKWDYSNAKDCKEYEE